MNKLKVNTSKLSAKSQKFLDSLEDLPKAKTGTGIGLTDGTSYDYDYTSAVNSLNGGTEVLIDDEASIKGEADKTGEDINKKSNVSSKALNSLTGIAALVPGILGIAESIGKVKRQKKDNARKTAALQDYQRAQKQNEYYSTPYSANSFQTGGTVDAFLNSINQQNKAAENQRMLELAQRNNLNQQAIADIKTKRNKAIGQTVEGSIALAKTLLAAQLGMEIDDEDIDDEDIDDEDRDDDEMDTDEENNIIVQDIIAKITNHNNLYSKDYQIPDMEGNDPGVVADELNEKADEEKIDFIKELEELAARNFKTLMGDE